MSAIAVERQTGETRLAVEAMATRFELVLYGDDATRLRAAGEEALAEITRLDRQLSAFRPTSDITWINAHAGDGRVAIEPRLFELLQRCRTFSALTDGAFDITIGPLMCAWRFRHDRGSVPDEPTRVAALAAVGWSDLVLEADDRTVTFARPGMSLDLGAAGKGYAIDCAINVLRENGIACALLHGGTSSVHAIGKASDAAPWTIAWRPSERERRTFALNDSALSISGVHGKSFLAEGKEYGHVIDPRTGMPTTAASAAAITGPRSLECDALSTALLVLGPMWLPTLHQRFPEYCGTSA